jgi:hypothetical protein
MPTVFSRTNADDENLDQLFLSLQNQNYPFAVSSARKDSRKDSVTISLQRHYRVVGIDRLCQVVLVAEQETISGREPENRLLIHEWPGES